MAILDAMKEIKDGETIRDKGERSSVDGLHLRARGGKKTFRLYYRSKQGVQRFPKIGELGQITLAQARVIAKDILIRVAKGEDPQEEWTEARNEITVQELFDKVYADYWSKPRFIKSGWAGEVKSLFARNVEPAFGRQKLSSVKRADVIAWHGRYSAMPSTGNRSLEVLSKMFSKAEEYELIERNTSPCWRVKAFAEKKRNRYASTEEVVKLLHILEREKSKNPHSVAFVYLMLFTGTRPSALARATPSELSREVRGGETYGVLRFHGKTTSDSGEDEVVVIPPVAMEILDSMPRPYDGTLLGTKDPKKFWQRIRREAGCTDLWLRDLRRTFATIGMSNGVDKAVIGKLLNHSLPQTTDLYAKLQLESRMDAVSTIADRITQIGKVVPIR